MSTQGNKGRTSMNADKQLIAKILFTKEQLDQKVVAQKVGVSEKTMSKWVNDFGWKNLRRRLLNSKEEQLNNFYEQLEEFNNHIKLKEPGKRFANNKEYDGILKLTASIKNLEQELNIAEKMEAGKQFIKHVQKAGWPVEKVIELTDMWHEFIQESLK